MFKIISGYLTGLSVGVFCLGTCLPLFLPLLLSQKRSNKKSIGLVLEFSLGRLIGYIFFGAVIGYLGQKISSNFIHLLASLGNLWIGVLMILYSLGAVNKKFCPRNIYKNIQWPILLGFLTGVNICPPFLASLTHVFNLQDVFASIIYFLMFFLGTSTYIVPAAFLGIISQNKLVRKLAQLSGIVMGIYFIVNNFLKFW